MRIAVISYWSCPLTRLGVLSAGGMSVYVLNLANSLGKLGHKVDIFTRAHKENDESVLSTEQHVRIIHLSSKLADHYQNVEFFSTRVFKFIQINSLSYDIIHAHYFYSGLAGIFLQERLSLPLIQTFHTLGLMKELYGSIKDSKRIRSEKEITSKVQGVAASTELEKLDLINRYGISKKKVFVVPPGVNHRLFKNRGREPSRLRLHLPKEKKIVLFVGRIDQIKGISFLIEAIAKLTQKHSAFMDKFRVLLIGGDIQSQYFWQNPEVKKIRHLIAERNLDCCVKFIGSSPHNLLPYYYSASDVVVMPSVYESFGLVVLEAMAARSCVLASKVGGLKYLINDKVNGRLFASGDVGELCRILWELLGDQRQRIILGKKAQVTSQNFCWDKQAQKMLTVYGQFI